MQATLKTDLDIVQYCLCQIRLDWSDPRGHLRLANDAMQRIRRALSLDFDFDGIDDIDVYQLIKLATEQGSPEQQEDKC